MISMKPSMKTCGVLGNHRSDKTDALCRAKHRSERFAIRKSHHSRSEVVSTATLISEAHGKLSSFQMSWLFATHMSSWPEVCDQHLERCWLFYCSSSVFFWIQPALPFLKQTCFLESVSSTFSEVLAAPPQGLQHLFVPRSAQCSAGRTSCARLSATSVPRPGSCYHSAYAKSKWNMLGFSLCPHCEVFLPQAFAWSISTSLLHWNGHRPNRWHLSHQKPLNSQNDGTSSITTTASLETCQSTTTQLLVACDGKKALIVHPHMRIRNLLCQKRIIFQPHPCTYSILYGSVFIHKVLVLIPRNPKTSLLLCREQTAWCKWPSMLFNDTNFWSTCKRFHKPRSVLEYRRF